MQGGEDRVEEKRNMEKKGEGKGGFGVWWLTECGGGEKGRPKREREKRR